MINVTMSTDDNYAVRAATVIASMIKHTDRKINVYILYTKLSDKSKQRLHNAVPKNRKSQVKIFFKSVADFDFSYLPLNRSHISEAAYYRLVLQDVLSVDKIIYLDCDVSVEDDIGKLYDIPIEDNYAVVMQDETEIFHNKRLGLEHYFNSGVLVLNLKKLREENAFEKFEKVYNDNKDVIKYQDQDILNIAFKDKCKYTHVRWNANTTIFDGDVHANALYTVGDERYARIKPGIIHYTGKYKPWQFISNHPYRKKYMSYVLASKSYLEFLKLALSEVISWFFKIDRTYREFTIRLFTISIFSIYGFYMETLEYKLFDTTVWALHGRR